MDMAIVIAGIAILSLLVGVGAGFLIRKKAVEGGINAAKNVAEGIIGGAKKEAENTIKEASIQAKDKLYQSKIEFEKEEGERRKEIQSLEKRLQMREESLDKKFDALEKREGELVRRERALPQQEKKLEDMEKNLNTLAEERRKKIEEISGMSSEDAKKMLLDTMENEARLEAARTVKRIEDETKAEAEMKSKEILALAIQRYAGEYVAEHTVSVVSLPNDEMKGRIIGREGRNIRAIEAITGIDIIIDDTPGAVILSGHNPVRREIAKLALERLVLDGRIHPARIEEIVQKVEGEVEKSMQEAGERAVFDTGLHGIHPELQKLIGRLKFRTSYAQNVYTHSLEVAFICGIMADELKLPAKVAKRAGLLHDIGKAVDHEVEGTHAAIGADLAKKYGESPKIVAAVAQHHDDRPESIFGILVQAADTLSAARPGARREMYESYIKRLEDLERIAKDFKGVDKSYALQAGREVRVIVESASVNDEMAVLLSKDIAKKIEKELSYPGQVKITVIRETRAVGYAR
ncbi:MAG: ribonuclease Y [Deltaproteobacteria bacterium]|nr:ribonuclease Y [Deltaproteobacteria bacterium]